MRLNPNRDIHEVNTTSEVVEVFSLAMFLIGSASPDFCGGEREADNLYANSLFALWADTGKVAQYRVVRRRTVG
jgi:hypothetical protein